MLPEKILGVVDRRPWLRILPLAVVGAGVAVLVQWIAQETAPTVEVRAVISSVGSEQRNDDEVVYSVEAVTAAGDVIDVAGSGNGAGLTGADAGIEYGVPVVITRSTFDGQVLTVRSPTATVPVGNHTGATVLRVVALVVAAAALVLGGRGWSRRTIALPALCVVVGALLFGWVIRPDPDLGPARYPPPDAMAGFADPPTVPVTGPLMTVRSVDEIVAVGTPVVTAAGRSVTVTGPPRPPVSGGADGFRTFRVPIRVDRAAGQPGSLPNLVLIGPGTGRAVELAGPGCEGFVCFVLPDDFVPRYLVLLNDDVAIDLGRIDLR